MGGSPTCACSRTREIRFDLSKLVGALGSETWPTNGSGEMNKLRTTARTILRIVLQLNRDFTARQNRDMIMLQPKYPQTPFSVFAVVRESRPKQCIS
jgi:hypothetical protein